MAKFHVGQRVRVVKWFEGVCEFPKQYVGMEGKIINIRVSTEYPIDVALDAGEARRFPFAESELAPAVEPDVKADEFIQKIKSLGPLEQENPAAMEVE